MTGALRHYPSAHRIPRNDNSNDLSASIGAQRRVIARWSCSTIASAMPDDSLHSHQDSASVAAEDSVFNALQKTARAAETVRSAQSNESTVFAKFVHCPIQIATAAPDRNRLSSTLHDGPAGLAYRDQRRSYSGTHCWTPAQLPSLRVGPCPPGSGNCAFLE
jgi:hypothetical protein